MNEFFLKLKERFNNLKKEQKIFIVLITVLVFIIFTSLIVWSSRTEWVPLFKGMDTKSAGKVLSKLKETTYQYKIQDDGTTILVPLKDKSLITLELANSDSLPTSSEGFSDIFKESGMMGETRERERLNFIRGLQGELEKTISQINQIERVRVHIVIPQKRLFEEDQENPTSSVVLKLKPYESLKIDQIKGIQNLVAYSVEGLKPQNVKIIDIFGRTLSDKVMYEDSESGKTTIAMKLQKEYEKGLQKKVQSMLEKVLGPGKAVVRVVAELDFDKIETSSKKFSPPVPGEDGGIKRSEEIEKENYKGVGVVPGGVPGVDTNIPGYKGVNEENTEYNRNKNINNYELNTLEMKSKKAPGAIKRLSISVIVDGKLDDKEQKALAENVKNAIGFINGRDSIQFTQMKFSKELVDSALKEWEAAQRKKLIITISVLSGLLLFALFIFLIVLWKKRKEERLLMEENEDEEIIELDDDLGTTVTIEEQEKKKMEDKIKDMAKKNPAEMASVLKLWMMEE